MAPSPSPRSTRPQRTSPPTSHRGRKGQFGPRAGPSQPGMGLGTAGLRGGCTTSQHLSPTPQNPVRSTGSPKRINPTPRAGAGPVLGTPPAQTRLKQQNHSAVGIGGSTTGLKGEAALSAAQNRIPGA